MKIREFIGVVLDKIARWLERDKSEVRLIHKYGHIFKVRGEYVGRIESLGQTTEGEAVVREAA